MSGTRYTDGRYAASNPSYHVEDSAWKAAQVIALLESASVRPATIVEIGCGAGEVVQRVSEALPGASRVEGWDVSPLAIGLCQARADGRLVFHQGDLLETDVLPFDVVLCLDVVEHVEDYLGFLRRLRAKGRRFVFHVPLDISAQSVLRETPIERARKDVGHLHYFTKTTALAALETAGYLVESWRYTAGSLDLPDRSWLQRLARMPRRFGFAVSPDFSVRLLGGYSLLVLAR